MKCPKFIIRISARVQAKATYNLFSGLYIGWNNAYNEYLIAEEVGDKARMEALYFDLLNREEFLMEERCYMEDALVYLKKDEFPWIEDYNEKIKKMDDEIALINYKRRSERD